MKSKRSLLVVGHSHVECISAAASTISNDMHVRVINLHRLSKQRMNAVDIISNVQSDAKRFKPEFLCLSLGGNKHNVLGILENPIPFSIGESASGSVPSASSERQFIPSAIIEDIFRGEIFDKLAARLYEAFPNAKRLYLNPPPPIPDFDHIKKHPGIFRNMLHLGPAPSQLRMYLYKIQTEMYREFALHHNAIFVEPIASLLNPDGFLAPEYFNQDPTHGNLEYGKVMLNELLEVGSRVQ